MSSKKAKEARQVKILATLGPASMDKSVVQKMDQAGVDIFRVNLSHTQVRDIPRIINALRSWTNKPIALDSEGAQIRTGKFKNNKVEIKPYSLVTLHPATTRGDSTKIPLYPINPAKIFKPGDLIYIEFDSVILQGTAIRSGQFLARTLSGGVIGSNKAVAMDRVINLPPFTKKDLAAFSLAKKLKITDIGFSFADSPHAVQSLRKLFPYPLSVISKIESRTGIRNLKEIAKESDAVLIDRGDLSRDVPLQELGLAQRYILNLAKGLDTPVYVATNLLESMIHSLQPTRAEINDITSTLLAGANGLVLAAETAIGKYPVESVRMVAGVIKETEDYLVKKYSSERYDGDLYDYYFSLIPPHGGKLIQNFADQATQKEGARLHR